jgi:DHA2 family methylenomycin A resistance protein-like MFS transporter
MQRDIVRHTKSDPEDSSTVCAMRPTSQNVVLVALSLGFASIVLDASALAIAAPAIGEALHASVGLLQWVSNSYVIAYAGFLLSTGRMVDRFGAGRALVWSTAAFALFSLLCAGAWSVPVLIAARFCQGAAGAMVTTASFALLAHSFPNGPERARGFAVMNLSGSIGLTIGPVVGGLLTQALSWRWIFVLNVVISGLVLVGARRMPRTAATKAMAMDVPGQVVSITMLVLLAWFLIRGGEVGWGTPSVLLAAAGFAVAFAAFLVLQVRGRDPMLPLGLMKIRAFAVGSIACGAWRMSLYGALFFLSLYFQDALGYTTGVAGLAFVPMTVAPIATNALSARSTRVLGASTTAVVGFLMAAIGAVVLMVGATSDDYWVFAVALALIGGGGGLAMPAIGSRALQEIPGRSAGVASGVFNACGQTGSLIGVATLGGIALMGPGLRQVALVIAVTVLLTAALIAYVVAVPDRRSAG